MSESPAGPPQVAAADLHVQISQAFLDWRDDVYRYLLTLGLHSPQAQDATQEVFLHLYLALRKQEKPILNQRAWAFRVAHNLGLTLRTRESALRPFAPDLALLTVFNWATSRWAVTHQCPRHGKLPPRMAASWPWIASSLRNHERSWRTILGTYRAHPVFPPRGSSMPEPRAIPLRFWGRTLREASVNTPNLAQITSRTAA